jgi:hypothetical protein
MCVCRCSGVRTRVPVECEQVKRPSRAHRARVVIPVSLLQDRVAIATPRLLKSP